MCDMPAARRAGFSLSQPSPEHALVVLVVLGSSVSSLCHHVPALLPAANLGHPMSRRLLNLGTFRRKKGEEEPKHFPAVHFSMFKPRPSMGVSRPSMSRAWGNLNMVGAVTRGLGRLSMALPSPGASPGRIAAAAEPPADPVTPPPLPEEAALASGAAALAAVDVGSSGGLYMAPGAEAAIEEAQRAAAQARQRALEVCQLLGTCRWHWRS